MDNVGYRARRRANKESEEAAQRVASGIYEPFEQDAEPINSLPLPRVPEKSPGLPPLPPPKGAYQRPLNGNVATHKPVDGLPDDSTTYSVTSTVRSHTANDFLKHLSPKERSEQQRIPTMSPHLQLMVGPLLRYDTVVDGVWHGAALVVTADAGSVYEPYPKLSFYWDAEKRAERATSAEIRPESLDLGPHPSDPSAAAPSTGSVPIPSSVVDASKPTNGFDVFGQDIWVFAGNNGTFTFWRFMIRIPLSEHELRINYNLNGGQELNFYVPGINENMRWAAHSCNGFSAGVAQDQFCGPGFKSGYDPVWTDLLSKHAVKPFHALVGGGDQLYCDVVMREPEMQPWVTESKPESRKKAELTDEIKFGIDRFYFNHYCQAFRRGAFARANCSIPMLNMADDHDLIDGFGSYPEDLQNAPIFKFLGERAYFFYLLFQNFVNPDIDGFDDVSGKHPFKSIVIGGPGAYIPFRSHSYISYLGPKQYICLLDTRAERKKEVICSPEEYQKIFLRLQQLPRTVEHLTFLLGVPLAYPRMVFMESALDSKLNPLTYLGRAGSLGLSGFVNKFNAEAELLDDLNDHWTAKGHKAERNWFIEQCQAYAKDRYVRVSFVSGDVHCGAVGALKSLAKGKTAVEPSHDHRYMLNVVTSAIVNTPPPNAVITLVSTLATKTHRTLHDKDTDETMIPLFATETNGKPRKQKFIMGARNWCAIEVDKSTGDLVFDLRVEITRGRGETVGYTVRTPAPLWPRELGAP